MKKETLLAFSIIIAFSLVLLVLNGCTQQTKYEWKDHYVTTCSEEVCEEYDLEDACTQYGTGFAMTLKKAFELAENSECAKQGILNPEKDLYCNKYTGTWWIGLDVKGKEGCNPACVVYFEDNSVKTNWRCTGLIE